MPPPMRAAPFGGEGGCTRDPRHKAWDDGRTSLQARLFDLPIEAVFRDG
jgi:hypothetical protein